MTTKEKVAKYLNIEINASMDASIEFWISAVSAHIAKKTGRTFEATEYEEICKGSGTHYLMLKNYPVSELTKVEYNAGEVGSPVWVELEEAYYTLKDLSGMIYYEGGFFRAEAEYRVTYTAGYGEESGGGTIPDDLSLCATAMVAEIIKNHSGLTRGTKSERMGELAITFDELTSTLPDMISSILKSYRTPRI